jgi:hypothetical protein
MRRHPSYANQKIVATEKLKGSGNKTPSLHIENNDNERR